MTDAPERIWLHIMPTGIMQASYALSDEHESSGQVCFLRLDLHEAAVAAARAKERAIWVSAIETYFDATAVMDVETHADRLRAEASA
jgi:hypothetical protein